eukprot:2815302-Rhodomonas_salina.1
MTPAFEPAQAPQSRATQPAILAQKRARRCCAESSGPAILAGRPRARRHSSIPFEPFCDGGSGGHVGQGITAF